jgi:hypothetical protein
MIWIVSIPMCISCVAFGVFVGWQRGLRDGERDLWDRACSYGVASSSVRPDGTLAYEWISRHTTDNGEEWFSWASPRPWLHIADGTRITDQIPVGSTRKA